MIFINPTSFKQKTRVECVSDLVPLTTYRYIVFLYNYFNVLYIETESDICFSLESSIMKKFSTL